MLLPVKPAEGVCQPLSITVGGLVLELQALAIMGLPPFI